MPNVQRWLHTPTQWYRWRGLHLLVGLFVAILTVVFAAQRATNGVRSTIDNRLIVAGADTDAGLVGIEAEQLSVARAISFTVGVGRAIARHDGPELNRLVTPLQANSTAPMVDIVQTDGRVILAVRSKGAPAPVGSRRGLRALSLALAQAHGPRGGRLTELAIFRSGPTLVTISPVADRGTIVGAVLAMTPLADILGRLSQEVGTDLTAYDGLGAPIATTTAFNPTPVDATSARALLAGGAVETRYLYADHREKLGRLIVDHAPQAVLGVSLEDDSNLTGRAVALFVALGLAATVVALATFWARFVNRRDDG